MLQAALNGRRTPAEHPALPITPEQLAADALAVRAAGADALHVHPRDAEGEESLRPAIVAPALAAIRAAVPGMPVGVSTGAWIEPDPERLLALVRAWARLPDAERPDYASVNCAEDDARGVIAALATDGIGVEAGVATPAGVDVLSASSPALLRVLIEPTEADPARAAALAWAIEERLDEAGVTAPRLHHAFGPATWNVLAAAAARARDVRVGLEDTLRLADGTPAQDNAALVTSLASMLGSGGRPHHPSGGCEGQRPI